MSSREIRSELGISQATLSRLVREAGPLIARFGRSVATRYALPREVVGVGRRTPVYRVDEAGNASEHGAMHFLARDGCWLERKTGDSQLYFGLPPFAADMAPQGFLGRGFAQGHPEPNLPRRVTDWNNDHKILSLANYGEDCVGNLIIGDRSLDRFLAMSSEPRMIGHYDEAVSDVLAGQVGSSAGGEQPKFAYETPLNHFLVKFMIGDAGASGRWRDLLVAEQLALEVLRTAGFATPNARWFDLGETRYLEVERFDRIGRKGRRGVVSLASISHEFFDQYPESWSQASRCILDNPALTMSAEDAERMVWLDTFGNLIANTDRHFGNLSFFAEDARKPTLSLAPVYDMLPMLFAPAGNIVIERHFVPGSPTAANLRVWHEAADYALKYWYLLGREAGLSDEFRWIAGNCHETLALSLKKHRSSAES